MTDRKTDDETDEPLADLAARVTDSDRSTTDDVDDLFDREDVSEIDSDRLWDRLERDDAPNPVADDEREIREIDAQNYCHQCEHFAVPPTVACTREDTDILELAALETFRVADCPVVLEDEALEREY